MKGKLSPNTMFELLKLFKKRNWQIDNNGNVKNSLFQRYCDRLKYLDDEEQKLFIELSYQFKQIGISEYIEFFLMSMHGISDEVFKRYQKIIISPLIEPFVSKKKNKKELERPKTKSSQFLYYLLASHDLRWFDYSFKFEFCESISEVKKNFIENNTLLLLVDDFVGTGETAINCCTSIVEDIRKIKNIKDEELCVISIAAMEQGVIRISNELKIVTYTDLIQKRGISDNYVADKKELYKELMIGIEKKLYCPKKYSLGFGKSEALISFMNKTPNNTFPAYWHETSTKIAPFPRYKNFK